MTAYQMTEVGCDLCTDAPLEPSESSFDQRRRLRAMGWRIELYQLSDPLAEKLRADARARDMVGGDDT